MSETIDDGATPPRRSRAKGKPKAASAAKAVEQENAGPKSAGRGQGVTVRHYCQGIGDCHLLGFQKAAGGTFFVLIDCGVHSSVSKGSETIAAIAADIAQVTSRHIDLLVVTHEHWDHVSGFLTASEIFKTIVFDEVWMGWTENPADPQARGLDKFKNSALDAIREAAGRLERAHLLDEHLGLVREGVESVMGFNFGVKGERVRTARDAAAALVTPKPPRYLEPKDEVLALPGVEGIRVYVLGPPRDASLLGLTDRASEMYGVSGNPGWALSAMLNGAFGIVDDPAEGLADPTAPFDPSMGSPLADAMAESLMGTPGPGSVPAFLADHYCGPATDGALPDQSWRRIDNDWLAMSADLAMQLDDRTNNTSLVLAFEFAETGRVLLFAADAQIGSWLSWQDLRWGKDDKAVTAQDLLARTVHYKVGHHGSQNATAKARGLQLMTSPLLSAFIPTNAEDALKVRWGRMPFDGILKDLEIRTQGRVVRADDLWLKGPTLDPKFTAPTGALRETSHDKKDGLWVQFEFE